MSNLVFLEPSSVKSIPYTTSDIIAEQVNVDYRSIQRTIETHHQRLEKFGQVRFQITPVKNKRGTNDKKIYYLNEEQATLLVTFLKNTDIVADFKTELVRQFYLMRTELQKRQINREQLKPIRRELTDVINENPEHSKWDFKLYTDLAYKIVTGRNAAQIRKDRGASKTAVAIDFMTADEIAQIAKIQNQLSVLCEMGLNYHQIKTMMLNRKMVPQLIEKAR